MKLDLEHNKEGFTLVELLVVITIILLLSVLSVVALNSARVKTRDNTRISQIKQIQTALQLFYNNQNGYPAGKNLVLGKNNDSSQAASFSQLGFVSSIVPESDTIYMQTVPAYPGPPNDKNYIYSGINTPNDDCSADQGDNSSVVCNSYEIKFFLEDSSGGLGKGWHIARPEGIE